MATILNVFVENTKILPSKVNENFSNLLDDITTVSNTVSNHTSSINSLQTQVSEISTIVGSGVGNIIYYTKTTAPSGYLVCDGSAISRTTYADLFAVIGTTFGGGNGSTTFNLPNLINRVVKGASSLGADTTGGSVSNTDLSHYHSFAGVQYGSAGGNTNEKLGDHNHTFSINTFKLLPCIKY